MFRAIVFLDIILIAIVLTLACFAVLDPFPLQQFGQLLPYLLIPPKVLFKPALAGFELLIPTEHFGFVPNF